MDCDFHDFPASDREIAGLFYLTMSRSGDDLRWASDEQVAAGLWALFDPGWSNIGHVIISMECWSEKEATIRSVRYLYDGVFGQRCRSALSHLDEAGTAVNTICYMLWDVSPLGLGVLERDCTAEQGCVVEVMREALLIDHDACRESALHGLNHLAHRRPDLVIPAIGDFLRTAGAVRPELITYAQRAAHGLLQ